MSTSDSDFQMPPTLVNAAGEERRVGVEIELANLSVREAAAIVQSTFGGQIVEQNPFVARVENTELGDFRVELDAALLKDEEYRDVLDTVGIDRGSRVEQLVVGAIESIAEIAVPCEIVTPPIPITQLSVIERLREELYAAGAHGTNAASRYAFGLHFNPELPSKDPAVLRDHLRAFIVLHDWIVERSEIDTIRRITPYIRPFPRAYADAIFRPHVPTRRSLIREYIEYNPTRNRPLDMLPAFRHLDEALVDALLPRDALVGSRPTFHYRLPNSRVDEPTWRIWESWNRWVLVERLAASPTLLASLGHEYLETTRVLLGSTAEHLQHVESVMRTLATEGGARPSGAQSASRAS